MLDLLIDDVLNYLCNYLTAYEIINLCLINKHLLPLKDNTIIWQRFTIFLSQKLYCKNLYDYKTICLGVKKNVNNIELLNNGQVRLNNIILKLPYIVIKIALIRVYCCLLTNDKQLFYFKVNEIPTIYHKIDFKGAIKKIVSTKTMLRILTIQNNLYIWLPNMNKIILSATNVKNITKEGQII